MARKKVGPYGAVDRYVEEMTKTDETGRNIRAKNYEAGILGYVKDPDSLNLTKHKLFLYQQNLRKRAKEISAAVNAAVQDYITSLGTIPRHRKQQLAVKKIAEQKPVVEASVKRVTEALAALAVMPVV
jgi:hypothetical protein